MCVCGNETDSLRLKSERLQWSGSASGCEHLLFEKVTRHIGSKLRVDEINNSERLSQTIFGLKRGSSIVFMDLLWIDSASLAR
eukprot:1191676-Prorocentrum_minimum.AAC.6